MTRCSLKKHIVVMHIGSKPLRMPTHHNHVARG
jgi:hypothetical protein